MKKDNSNECFQHVDESGNVIGRISRGEAHNGSKLLHPVVHLHVFNRSKGLYLQKRPEWKDIQPGKWDTACGGHVDYGETIDEALRREVSEELGIKQFTPVFIKSYVFESLVEKELVNVFCTIYDEPIHPSTEELDGGRYWSVNEIVENIGNSVFTPNFENEFAKVLQKGLIFDKLDIK